MAGDSDKGIPKGGDPELLEKERVDTTPPSMYRVILLNDDYTTREFVVFALMKIYHKDSANANRIMLDVHNKGAGEVGVYSYDIAKTKIEATHTLARKHGFPLRCTLEPVE